jgi:CRP/FNR family transcriptional regulator
MTNTVAEFKQAVLVNTLRSCQLFTGLSPENLHQIAAITVAKPVAKGVYLFHEGDPSLGFYIVQSGAINLHRVNGAGKEQVIHVFRAGESFAEGTLASDNGYPVDARAVESSLKRQPELALRMLGSMSAHLRILVAQLEDLTLKDVETRLSNWLVKRCPNPTSDKPLKIDLPMTKRLLAAELGTVSETFSRTLAKFREQGFIEVNGKAITVLSPARLHALLRKNLGE